MTSGKWQVGPSMSLKGFLAGWRGHRKETRSEGGSSGQKNAKHWSKIYLGLS